MVAFNDVQAQLVSLNPGFHFMGVSEVRKLARTLEPQEKILECMKVWHKGRATLLCATDQKIVCLDVRSVGHSLPHISYDDVKGVLVQQKGFMKLVRIHTLNGIVQFTMWRKQHAKDLKVSIDRHISHLRNSYKVAATSRSRKIEKRAYTTRSWRSLAKKVGATSIAG